MDEFLVYILTFSIVTLGVVVALRSWLNSRRSRGSSSRSYRRSSSRRHRRGRHRSSRRGMRSNRPIWRPFDQRSNENPEAGGPPDNPPQN